MYIYMSIYLSISEYYMLYIYTPTQFMSTPTTEDIDEKLFYLTDHCLQSRRAFTRIIRLIRRWILFPLRVKIQWFLVLCHETNGNGPHEKLHWLKTTNISAAEGQFINVWVVFTLYRIIHCFIPSRITQTLSSINSVNLS